MVQARKKRNTTSKIGNKPGANPSRLRGRKRRSEDGKDFGMGGTVSSQEDPPKQKIHQSLQTTEGIVASMPSLPVKSDIRMCTKKPAVVPAGGSTSPLQFPQCSTTTVCEGCLYPCPDGTCTNKSCPVVSLLLACDRVTKSGSYVYGCPLFRACPNCHNIMMHETGCKYVTCAKCSHRYCFICLRTTQECTKDKTKYWSLTCSAPNAARQRFQT